MASSRTVTLDGGTTITYDYTVLNKVLGKLKGKHAKVVADGVNYGIYWELGHTVTRKDGGQVTLQHPYMVPAAEKWRKPFADAMKAAAKDGYLTVSVDDVVDKVAHGVELAAKQEIEAIKDKGNGKSTDLVDTGALKNSITVLDPEDV
jgi:hypothetical protein